MPTSIPSKRDDWLPGFGQEPSKRGAGAGRLIMLLLIASLGMGIAALIVFFVVVRFAAPVWPPPGTPPPPRGLWISTAIILLSSVTMHGALRAVRRNDGRRMRAAALATLILAVAFLVCQVVNWRLAYAAHMPPRGNMYAVLFYVLTGMHGLHIIAGLAPLTIVTVKSWRGRYSAASHNGVLYCTMYWHFVDAAWIALFATLLMCE